jgi:hypothetical protein
MGGNLINYPEDVGTPTATLLLIKIPQQCHIDKRGQICQCRSGQLLSYDTIKTARICQDQID